MTFEIKVAKRLGARLLIQLSGVSGSGKTYTGLQLAYGLTGGDSSKIIGIDTENRRMSLYSDCLPNGDPFRVLEFFAPFSPARYIEAINASCDAGAEVIVIDSVSHEWESEGGCEWIANSAPGKIANWKDAKREHKRFMTNMLQCSAHIIACTRAREKSDFSDTKNIKSLGIQPIQEKNFSFEATVSLMMTDQGKRQDVLKCPAELQRILGRGTGYITAADGAALRRWVDGGGVVDPEVEKARGLLLNAAEQGMEALKAVGPQVSQSIRDVLGRPFLDSVAASARAFDEGRRSAENPVVLDLNHQIAAAQESPTTEPEPTPEPEPQAPNSEAPPSSPNLEASSPNLGPSSLTLEPTSGPERLSPATEPGTAERLPQGRTIVAPTTDPQPAPLPAPAAPAAGRRPAPAPVRRSDPAAAPAAEAPIPGLD